MDLVIVTFFTCIVALKLYMKAGNEKIAMDKQKVRTKRRVNSVGAFF